MIFKNKIQYFSKALAKEMADQSEELGEKSNNLLNKAIDAFRTAVAEISESNKRKQEIEDKIWLKYVNMKP